MSIGGELDKVVALRFRRMDEAGDRPPDQRDPGGRDRDRILYTSALRRLAGITQVVASSEGAIFHNRLTHTHEVAQIARRVAQFLLGPATDEDRHHMADELRLDYENVARRNELARQMRLDPEVAEAAALAHDLGHPPFGHAAEQVLNEAITGKVVDGRVVDAGCVADGFEGNAQSFRVVTKLSVRLERDPETGEVPPGLNLARATLDAILKYPWQRDLAHERRLSGYRDVDPSKKWGAFESEREEFLWVREGHRLGLDDDGERSIEAEVMDWADDVAYAVHDLDDFYRAGLVPLDRLLRRDDRDHAEFWNGLNRRWDEGKMHSDWDRDELHKTFESLMDFMRLDPITRPFAGHEDQRGSLRTVTARLIRRYVVDLSLEVREPTENDRRLVSRSLNADKELALLKELIWQYAILHPRLASQQAGKRTIIESLYKAFRDAAEKDGPLLPFTSRDHLRRQLDNAQDKDRLYVRIATDMICNMTEQQAIALYRRITGQAIGSILDVSVP